MGRKAGGKNYSNAEPTVTPVTVTQTEKEALKDIFTGWTKDFISVKDLQDMTGLGNSTCLSIMNDIKAVSDVFGVKKVIHRVDYYLYISRRMEIVNP